MKNIKLEQIRDSKKGEKYYMLFEVSFDSTSTYCIAARDDELSINSIGNDILKANDIYDMISCGEVSSVHVADIIRDLQNEIFV